MLTLLVPNSFQIIVRLYRLRLGEGLTPFVLIHRYMVDGWESDRTACQLPLTSRSTDRNVPSSRRLFFNKSRHQSDIMRLLEACVTYTRISANELDCHCLAGCEGQPCRHIDQPVTESMTDTRTVEDDTSLLLNDGQSAVFYLRKQKQDVRAMILHVTSSREEHGRTKVQHQPSHCRPGKTPDWNIC